MAKAIQRLGNDEVKLVAIAGPDHLLEGGAVLCASRYVASFCESV